MPAESLPMPQLGLAAQHAFGPDPRDDTGLYPKPAGQHRAELREEHPATRLGHVRRAADDLLGLAAVPDRHEREPVPLGVQPLRRHVGHDDPGQSVPEGLDRLDLDTAAGEPLGHLTGARIEARELAEPRV